MATRLLELLGGKHATSDAVIKGLTVDSRRVAEGDMFVAIPGTRVDGRNFIPEAVERGAAAILTTPDSAPAPEGLPVVEDSNPRRLYAQMAARFCGAQPGVQVAVTGTNGKTSVADFTRQIWQALGTEAASLGTLGVRSDKLTIDGGLTTPDPMALHAALAQLAGQGVDHVAIEASSHGLDQYRLDGTALKAAAFTNLTRDHLDYHRSEQAYFYAKARLFGDLLQPGATAVINIDDSWGLTLDDIAWGRSQTRISYGTAEAADLRLLGAEPQATGQHLSLSLFGAKHDVHLPLIGGFQAMNALAAIGLTAAAGTPVEKAVAVLQGLVGVPGRMELMGTKGGAGVFVDYAHTPDGLRTVLTAARAHNPRQLHIVFGCGGDRDAGKRPQMGAIAHELADRVYVTDDNPRSECPETIRQQILAAAPDAREIGDRAEAIAAAIDAAGVGDMIIIAGKGHETGQTVGDQVLPFSDIEAVRRLLSSAAQQGGTE